MGEVSLVSDKFAGNCLCQRGMVAPNAKAIHSKDAVPNKAPRGATHGLSYGYQYKHLGSDWRSPVV